jgi:hypothetical protein
VAAISDDDVDSPAMLNSRRLAAGALLLVPAGLMVYFAFHDGGYFPKPTAYVALVLCVVLLVRVLVGSPFEGAGWLLTAGAALLALYTVMVLVSQSWSHAPGEAAVEFDRALTYLAVLVLIGTVGRTRPRVVWLLHGLLVAIFVICTISLITRVLPHVWPIKPLLASNRLSFPLTYWNTLGVVAALGLILCLHFSADRREHPVGRVVASAFAPILAATLFFTFSRGAIGATAIGVVIYLLVGRPRLWLSALVAMVPPVAVTVKFAYDANLLATMDPTSRGAVSQGHRVALAVAVCAVAAAVLRALLALIADRAFVRARLPDAHRRRILGSVWGALAIAAVLAVIGLRGTISHEYHGFVSPNTVGGSGLLRSRLTDPGNDGRIPLWKIAWRDFKAHPVIGKGAGTFQNSEATERPSNVSIVLVAHSLYFENLDQLGVIGTGLLVAVILLILGTALARARGPDRPVYGAIFAVLLAWAIHSGVDWDWQMPALTLPIFALGGLVLARAAPETAEARAVQERLAPSSFMRGMLGVGCVLLAVAPAYMWLSQRDLNAATIAYNEGDCNSAARSAVSSIAIEGSQPKPYQVLGFCDVADGRPKLGVTAMQRAVSLDPGNWNYRFGLAIMKAAAGQNPRAAARKALSLNRWDPLVQNEFKTLMRAQPSQWSKDGYKLAQTVTTL